MFNRLLTWTGATNIDGGLAYVRDTALPIVREQRGYRGLSVSVDRSEGAFSILSIWETEDDRDASETSLSSTREEGNQVIGGELRVERLEDLAREVVRAPEPGSALMVTPFSMDPATIDEILEFFNNEIAPQLKTAPGFCALRNMVNRSTGEGYVGTTWQDRAAMEAQAGPAQARRDAASARGISFGPIRYGEFLLIDSV